ncbi:unnamed protein product [Calypogeia fissa]
MMKEGRGKTRRKWNAVRGLGARTHRMTTRSFSRSEREEDERVVPGLPDEIVLGHVVPKLPWQAFPVLSLVSRRWREANQSRCVYDARVRSHSTETLFVVCHGDKYEYRDHGMSLYSMRANPSLRLPPFPKSWGYKCTTIPRFQNCLSFDGKIYLLGRYFGDWTGDEKQYSEVFMLDLAGQREWKRCADMPQPKTYFGCGVAEGKIYVIGGDPIEKRPRQELCECFVYDPRANTWSPIRPMKQAFLVHRVFGVGKELFVMHRPHGHPAGLEVYHVDKDEWRSLGPWQKSLDEDECAMLKPWAFSKDLAQKMFSANGKLHMATPFGIYIYSGGSDGNLKLWTRLHSYWGFEEHYENQRCKKMGTLKGLSKRLRRLAVIAGNDELVALARYRHDDCGTYLYRSRGFNGEKEEIVWDFIVELEHMIYNVNFCSVQL